MVKQRAKIKWLRYGDGNNKYFHASIKSRQQSKFMHNIQKEDGTVIHTQKELENEVLAFYTKLMGTTAAELEGIDTNAMRGGPQLNADQRDLLTHPVTENEIVIALKGIDNDKSPGIDGYGAYFYKKAWPIIGNDVIIAIKDFFVNNRMYKPSNCSMVTLIPKHNGVKGIKHYRPIDCCSTLYKSSPRFWPIE